MTPEQGVISQSSVPLPCSASRMGCVLANIYRLLTFLVIYILLPITANP